MNLSTPKGRIEHSDDVLKIIGESFDVKVGKHYKDNPRVITASGIYLVSDKAEVIIVTKVKEVEAFAKKYPGFYITESRLDYRIMLLSEKPEKISTSELLGFRKSLGFHFGLMSLTPTVPVGYRVLILAEYDM
jgi:hypothetical protein